MLYYKIAGLNLQVDGVEHNKYLISRFKDYEVDGFENPNIFVRFNLDNSIDIPLPQHFASSNGRFFYENNSKFGFYDYIKELDRVVSFMETNRERTEFTYTFSDLTDIFGITPETTVVNVLGHLFSSSLVHYSGSVLHASTITYGGKAITFTAPSGTGKSTHTALWKDYYPDTVIINDDCPAVRYMDGTIYAFGTPWAGKTDINVNAFAPLKAMVFIERAEKPEIEELSPIDAFFRMIREIPVSVFKQQADLQLSFFDKLFKSVPAYLLKCDISKDAVDVVKDKLKI